MQIKFGAEEDGSPSIPAFGAQEDGSPSIPASSGCNTLCTYQPMQDHLMHKNQLHDYTQKKGLPDPIYRSTNEGLIHAPRFRSTVVVDGQKYKSLQTFQHKKEAEQQAAQYALKALESGIKYEGQQDTIFCKSILVEFSTKMKWDPPTYSTLSTKEPLPGFVSSLLFNGQRYTGEVARNRKEAEQLAALAAVQSLLRTIGSDSRIVLEDMIKAKRKLNAPLEREGSSSQQPTVNISDSVDGYSFKGKMRVCYSEEDQVVGNNEDSKRQRRWHTETLKVPEPQSNPASSTTPRDPSLSTTMKCSFSRSDSTASDDPPKERVVPPSPKSPTNSLRIDRFLRPFALKAVQELLGKTGSVTSFWMDEINTHCYVSYSSVEEAIETRNAVYNLQWPTNGGRLLVAEFVDPQEVKARVELPPPPPPAQAPATPVITSPKMLPPAGSAPAAPTVNPPQARERLQLPPPPPLLVAEFVDPQEVKTRVEPPLPPPPAQAPATPVITSPKVPPAPKLPQPASRPLVQRQQLPPPPPLPLPPPPPLSNPPQARERLQLPPPPPLSLPEPNLQDLEDLREPQLKVDKQECQICGKMNHTAFYCYHRQNLQYQPFQNTPNQPFQNTQTQPFQNTPNQPFQNTQAQSFQNAAPYQDSQPYSQNSGPKRGVSQSWNGPVFHTGGQSNQLIPQPMAHLSGSQGFVGQQSQANSGVSQSWNGPVFHTGGQSNQLIPQPTAQLSGSQGFVGQQSQANVVTFPSDYRGTYSYGNAGWTPQAFVATTSSPYMHSGNEHSGQMVQGYNMQQTNPHPSSSNWYFDSGASTHDTMSYF